MCVQDFVQGSSQFYVSGASISVLSQSLNIFRKAAEMTGPDSWSSLRKDRIDAYGSTDLMLEQRVERRCVSV